MLQINVFRVFHKKRTPVIEPDLHRGRGGVGNRYDTGITTYHLSYVVRALCFPLHHLTWSLGSVSVTISVNHCLFTNIWVTPSLGVTYFLWAWNLHWFSKNYGVINGQVKRTGRAFSCEFGLNLIELGTNSKAVFPYFLQYLLSRGKSSRLTPAPKSSYICFYLMHSCSKLSPQGWLMESAFQLKWR